MFSACVIFGDEASDLCRTVIFIRFKSKEPTFLFIIQVIVFVWCRCCILKVGYGVPLRSEVRSSAFANGLDQLMAGPGVMHCRYFDRWPTEDVGFGRRLDKADFDNFLVLGGWSSTNCQQNIHHNRGCFDCHGWRLSLSWGCWEWFAPCWAWNGSEC